MQSSERLRERCMCAAVKERGRLGCWARSRQAGMRPLGGTVLRSDRAGWAGLARSGPDGVSRRGRNVSADGCRRRRGEILVASREGFTDSEPGLVAQLWARARAQGKQCFAQNNELYLL